MASGDFLVTLIIKLANVGGVMAYERNKLQVLDQTHVYLTPITIEYKIWL